MSLAIYRMKQQLLKCDDIEAMARLYDEAKRAIDFGAISRGKKFSEEHKRKIGEHHKGSKNWNYGRKGELSPSYGRKHTDEENQKNRIAHLGKHHTEESKKKLSAANSGKNNPMYGKSIFDGMSLERKQAWIDKHVAKAVGRKWYTNGVINVWQHECPEGFVPGRTRRKGA